MYKDAAIHLGMREISLGPSVHAGLHMAVDSDYRVMVKTWLKLHRLQPKFSIVISIVKGK